jgi:hypothetical protein
MEPGGEVFRHFYGLRLLPVADNHHVWFSASALPRLAACRPLPGRECFPAVYRSRRRGCAWLTAGS